MYAKHARAHVWPALFVLVSALTRGGLSAQSAEGAGQVVEPSATLRIASAVGGEEFGYSIVVSGTTVLVGAHNEDHSGLSWAGVLHVFERNQGGPGA